VLWRNGNAATGGRQAEQVTAYLAKSGVADKNALPPAVMGETELMLFTHFILAPKKGDFTECQPGRRGEHFLMAIAAADN
jgi:hypothetical protein